MIEKKTIRNIIEKKRELYHQQTRYIAMIPSSYLDDDVLDELVDDISNAVEDLLDERDRQNHINQRLVDLSKAPAKNDIGKKLSYPDYDAWARAWRNKDDS